MSNPIDVGSVLGGRYKVTATVLTSHDHDLVLDGVDQVLNRPVSILVAGPDNTEQVAQSAREVATGERPGTVQVLDLGVTEAATYLITNHASAADLLDLVVASNPPYVEPFFTDTLGSEIFGQARSNEPEPYDDDEDEVDAGYINYADTHPSQVDPYPTAPVLPAKPPVRPAAGAAAASPAAAASGHDAKATAAHPVQPAQDADTGSGEPPAGGKPKVSLWSEDDYAQAGSTESSAETPEENAEPAVRKPSRFARAAAPAAAVGTAAAASGNAGSRADDDDEDESEREPRSMRWLVGGLLAVVLIGGLIFAVSNLGNLIPSGPQANTTAPQATGDSSGEPTPSSSTQLRRTGGTAGHRQRHPPGCLRLCRHFRRRPGQGLRR